MVANHGDEWHRLDEQIRAKMRSARAAWNRGDKAKGRELDREVDDLKAEQAALG